MSGCSLSSQGKLLRRPGHLNKAAVAAFSQQQPGVRPVCLAAHDALIVQIEAKLANAGLPELSWYDALWALDRAPAKRLRMHELADAAVIARSNLTRLIDRMEKAGLVERLKVEGDRRGAHAHLTGQGK